MTLIINYWHEICIVNDMACEILYLNKTKIRLVRNCGFFFYQNVKNMLVEIALNTTCHILEYLYGNQVVKRRNIPSGHAPNSSTGEEVRRS